MAPQVTAPRTARPRPRPLRGRERGCRGGGGGHVRDRRHGTTPHRARGLTAPGGGSRHRRGVGWRSAGRGEPVDGRSLVGGIHAHRNPLSPRDGGGVAGDKIDIETASSGERVVLYQWSSVGPTSIKNKIHQ